MGNLKFYVYLQHQFSSSVLISGDGGVLDRSGHHVSRRWQHAMILSVYWFMKDNGRITLEVAVLWSNFNGMNVYTVWARAEVEKLYLKGLID